MNALTNPPMGAEPTWSDVAEVLRLTHRMRAAQRAYFAQRSPERLAEAKKLEAAVDAKLAALTQGPPASPQPQLF